jgi:CheY-like chemotaxis protein
LTYVNGQVTFALSPLIRGIPLARKILLADDSVTAQNMGRKILADAGYEVIAVNNGSAALKKIAELKPDLVILDVYMPGYSGLEVCQRLKESPETARIPVLLTVGKLEPFKPEEAQRVRAEGFIVKPFEASELLGTLSKLEDKVVPRSEPSKPGRFARAIAAAEESGRGGREEPTDADNGWKSRIGFPKKRTEAEEKVADDASTHKPAEKVASKSNNSEDTRPGTEKAAEANVDVAALAPAGLPKDVTPEEVAAIAAAAAQMQMVASALKQERAPGNTDAESSAIPSQPGVLVAPDRTESNFASASEVSRDSAPAVGVETKTEASAEIKKDESNPDSTSSEPAALETYRRRKGDVNPDVSVEVVKEVRGEAPKEVPKEEAQDVPVTMAATAESVVAASAGGSRWTAVSVALEGSESAISLDQEMQKAYAAVAGVGSASIAAVSEAEPASAGMSSVSTSAAVETPAAISNPEPEPVSASEPVRIPPVETGSAPAAQAAAVASPFEVAAPVPIAAVNAPVEARAEASTSAASSESKQDLAPVPEPVASGTQAAQPQPDAATADAVAVPHAEEIMEKPPAEPVPEPKLDSETVKNTAAAWATWRQVHDSSQNNQAAEARPKETEQSESASPDTAARAVAAGAEQLVQEAAAAAADGDQSNVASIVDSVLADLRPKLMEEINRKMSKKK